MFIPRTKEENYSMKHKAILVACLLASLLAGQVFGAVVGKITKYDDDRVQAHH